MILKLPGNIDITTLAGNIVASDVVSTAGNVTLTSNLGSILDDNVDTTSIAGNVIILDAQLDVGATGAGPGTPVEFLDISAATGAPIISFGANTDNVFLNIVDATAAVTSSSFAAPSTTLTSLNIGVANQDFNFNDNAFGTGGNTFNFELTADNVGFINDVAGIRELFTTGSAQINALQVQ